MIWSGFWPAQAAVLMQVAAVKRGSVMDHTWIFLTLMLTNYTTEIDLADQVVSLYVDSGHSVNVCDDLIIEDGC